MAPGILAQSVLFIAIFYGISLICERDLGVRHKYLVSPAYRGALVFGKAVSVGLRALTQAAIVYVLSWVLGVRLQLTPAAIGGVLLTIFLGAAIFSTFSLVVACLVKTRERFMGIGQVLTMPLFFCQQRHLSSLPHAAMAEVHLARQYAHLPGGCAAGAHGPGGQAAVGVGVDFAVQALVLLVLLGIAARLYPDAIN